MLSILRHVERGRDISFMRILRPVKSSKRFLDFARNDKTVLVEHDNPLPLWDSGVSVVGDSKS